MALSVYTGVAILCGAGLAATDTRSSDIGAAYHVPAGCDCSAVQQAAALAGHFKRYADA